MTPKPAVAENLAQLVARPSQSRFSRRKASTVVPLCMMAFAKMAAEWHTEFRVCGGAHAEMNSDDGRSGGGGGGVQHAQHAALSIRSPGH